MPNTKQQSYQPITFDAIKIGLASPDKIRGGRCSGRWADTPRGQCL
jgi:hypothetical protein